MYSMLPYNLFGIKNCTGLFRFIILRRHLDAGLRNASEREGLQKYTSLQLEFVQNVHSTFTTRENLIAVVLIFAKGVQI